MVRFWGILLFVFSCVLTAWSLESTGPTKIYANDIITIYYRDGVGPYIVRFWQYPNTVIATFTGQTTGSLDWRVSVPEGASIAYQIEDAIGTTVSSQWITVQQDIYQLVSSVSVASVNSMRATQSYISQLSTAAAHATERVSGSTSPASLPAGAIIGGILGGVAGLLAIAIGAFWYIRKSTKARKDETVLPTVAPTPGWGSVYEKDTATIAMPSTPQRPESVATGKVTTAYGGLPEIHGGGNSTAPEAKGI